MKKLLLLFSLIPLLSLSQASDLFISEYIEGSGFNKAIEIYNGTGADVDLSTYSIKLYSNGSVTANSTFALSGILANGSTYLLVHVSCTDPTLLGAATALTGGVTAFNGDDAVELVSGATGIDVIGTIGVDPGTSWTVAGDATGSLNHTLVRFSGVCNPNTNWTASAGTNTTDSEWIIYNVDDFSFVGSHTAYCDVAACPGTSPVPTVTTPVNICSGNSTMLSAGTTINGTYINWYDSPSGGTLLFTGSDYTTAALTANVSYYAEEVVPNCPAATSRAQVDINVNALPTVNAGTDQAICTGTAITLSGSGAVSYTWDNGVTDGVSFTPASTLTYTVTGTDANSCVNTDQVVITVNPLATVNAGTDQTVCAGTMITLSGSGALTYAWDNGVSDGVAFAATATTTYTVTGTDVNGCQGTDAVIITVNALPVVNAGVDQSICTNGSVTLTASGANTYSWDNSVTDGVAFFPTSTTTYTVTGTDANACSNTDQVTITVNALPTVDAGADQAICMNDIITLSGAGALTYVWDNGVTDGVAFAPSGTTTYMVTGTDGNGCSADDFVTITVNSLPVVDGGADQIICAGTPTVLSASGANTYNWDNGVSDGVPFGVNVTTTYTVIGTDGNGCTNTDQVVINVNAAPPVNGGADQTVCENTMVTLSGTGALTYVWNNGVADGVAFAATTTQTYQVTGTDANGCTAFDLVTLTVNAAPTVNAGADQTVCAGTSVTLTATGTGTLAWDNGVTDGASFVPSSTLTYTVTATGGNSCTATDNVVVTVNALPMVNAGADISVCTGTSVTLSGSGAVNYSWDNSVTDGLAFTPSSTATYTVVGTDANNCSASDQVIITVNALPTVNAGADMAVCFGTSVTLSGSGATSYSWDNGVNDGVSFTPSATTTYTVTGNDANGCSATDQVTVTVNALPVINAGADFNACIGDFITLTATGAPTIVWDNGVNDGVAFAASTTGNYTATGTDANGCSATDKVFILVNPLPLVNAGADQSVCAGTAVTLSASGGVSYSWNNGISDGAAFVPTVTANYTVTGTDGNGCQNTDQVTVTVNAIPTIALSGNNPSNCGASDGTVTVSGTGSGTVSWSGQASGNSGATTLPFTISLLPAGNYVVTFTDANGCVSASASQGLSDPGAPTAPVVSASAASFCTGGSVTLTSDVTSGITWSTGATTASITVTSGGSYSATASLNNCTSVSNTVVITENALPIIIQSGNSNPSACGVSDGSVTINGSGTGDLSWTGASSGSVTGITLPYLLSGLGAGSYNITFDNGCPSNTIVASLSDPGTTTPVISASGATTFCAGGSVILTSSVSSGITWSTGETTSSITVNTGGDYAVTATSGGCSASSLPITVTVNPLPVINIDPVAMLCITDAPVTLTATPAGGVFSGSGVSGNQFDPSTLAGGNYTVTYTATVNGCSNSGTTSIVVDSCLSVTKLDWNKVDVYPVPAMNQLTISGDDLLHYQMVYVIDQLGRSVLPSTPIHSKSISLSVSTLPNGIYFLQLEGDGAKAIRRFEVLK